MKSIERQLDRLVQSMCENQYCRICGGKATAIHHIIGRSNKLFRYDIINLLPVCDKCHRLIHDKGLDAFVYVPLEVEVYLKEHKNDSYKNYLLENGMTEDDFLEECKIDLKRIKYDR